MGSLTSPMKHLPPVPPSAARKSDAAATERVAEMTCSLQEMVQDAASCFARVAGGAASYLGQKSEIAAAVVGSGLKSLGNTLRAHAPETGTVGQASATMAESLETTGRYLRGGTPGDRRRGDDELHPPQSYFGRADRRRRRRRDLPGHDAAEFMRHAN